jgi:hypothetical protein
MTDRLCGGTQRQRVRLCRPCLPAQRRRGIPSSPEVPGASPSRILEPAVRDRPQRVKAASCLVVQDWRAWRDSNSRPLGSEKQVENRADSQINQLDGPPSRNVSPRPVKYRGGTTRTNSWQRLESGQEWSPHRLKCSPRSGRSPIDATSFMASVNSIDPHQVTED